MSRGINKFIGIGNCCADPEVRYMPNGNAVTNISIACNETWKDKQTGQQNERAEFIRAVFFNRLAEIVGEYVKKGSKIYVEGKLATRKWTDQSGQDRYTTEVIVSEMQMLDSVPASQGDNYRQSGYQQGGQQDGNDDWFDDYDQEQQPQQPQQPQQQRQYQQPSQGQTRQQNRNPNGTQRSPYQNNPRR